MEALVRERKGAVLRIVDVGSWDSEVAQQHGVRRLPTLWLYDGGTLVTKDTQDVIARVNKLR